jgi:predicted transcriptional regulator of viral defense system
MERKKMAEEKKERLSRQEKKEQQLEAIRKLIEEKGGVAKTSELYNLGLDYRVLQRFVEEGKLERIKSGYYSLGYRKKSEEEIIPVLFPDGVLCMESGLYYQGYLKERPYIWSIAVDKNTSKSRFKMDYPIVHPYYTETKVLEMGVETFDMNGQKIKIYEKERLICDCLKYEDKLDADSLKKGLLAFIKDEEKDIAKLMMYARERRVVEKVRNRIGVWL